MSLNRIEDKLDLINSKLEETKFSLNSHILKCEERDRKVDPMIEDYYFTKRSKEKNKERFILFSKLCAPLVVISGLLMEIIKPGILALLLTHLK